MLKILLVLWFPEGLLPTAAPMCCYHDNLPFSSKLWHTTFHKICTKSVFIISKIWSVRYLTSCINKHASRADIPFSGRAGGLF